MVGRAVSPTFRPLSSLWSLYSEEPPPWASLLPRHRNGRSSGAGLLLPWAPLAMAALGLLLLIFVVGRLTVPGSGLSTPPLPTVLEAPEELEQCLAEASTLFSGGDLKREDFPADFVFGTATSAFQIEGAVATDGRGPSIWDKFTHTPGKISDGSNADVAVDSYGKFEEDVALLKAMGVQSYRFSIAWARVLPEGAGKVNEEGIAYYSRLVDALLREGITPAVTLYHWDLPQALQDKYGGWLSLDVVKDFAEYAAVCFERLGDRVKLWITINEPQQITVQGYGGGTFAPGRCSDRKWCEEGNSATEPYIVGHHVLLAHAAAVKEYRNRFQQAQGGRIGITLDCTYHFPADESSESDRRAAIRGMEFQLPWFADPIMNGSYPASMVESLGSRLPQFSPEQTKELLGSTDFLGLNFYTASFARAAGGPPMKGQENPWADRQVATQDTDVNGKPIGESCASPWLKIVPHSIYHMLKWLNARYPNLPIMITENGVSQDGSLPVPDLLCDKQRISYYKGYLTYILKAVREGVPLKAYYAWALVDNFEWASGYSQIFGIHYVDIKDAARPRKAKASALWWMSFLQGKTIKSSSPSTGHQVVSKVSKVN